MTTRGHRSCSPKNGRLSKVSEWRIPLSDLDYGAEEEAAALRVLKSKWLSMGSETKAFEDEFAADAGVRHAIAVANGTAALHLALLALGVGPGDEIVQPAVNFVASANMTIAVGATPVFGDIVGLDEPTLDPAEIQRLVTPRTKAVIVMHYGGYFCRMTEILDLCRGRGLFVIEDACHAVGAQFGDAQQRPPSGQKAGNLGDIACFSFFSNKNLAVGEGGMVTTNRDDLNDKVRNLRSHGMSTLTWDRHRGHAATYDVFAHGYNYRLDDLRSALGREQLKKLDRNNARRRTLTSLYWDRLKGLKQNGWILPFQEQHSPSPVVGGPVVRGPSSDCPVATSGNEQTKEAVLRPLTSDLRPLTSSSLPSCHLLPVVALDVQTRWRCAEALKMAGVQTSLHYPFIPTFRTFQTVGGADGVNRSKEFCARIITLPLHPTLPPSDVEHVAERLISAASH